MKNFIPSFLLALSVAIPADAAEKITAIENFREMSIYQLTVCRIQTQTALNQVELGLESSPWGKIGACIKNGRTEVKKLFPAALATVARKPAAAKLIKDYYAAWITAFNGISPEASERKITYEQRQSDADGKQEAAWNRFEIEAGL